MSIRSILLLVSFVALALLLSASAVQAERDSEYAVDIGLCAPFYCHFKGCCGAAQDGWKSCRRAYDDLSYIGWNGCVEKLL